MSHRSRRIVFLRIPAFLAIVIGGLGCATQAPTYTPAGAARAKVEFLKREGRHLNPIQESLIRRLPYERHGGLEARMQIVLERGGDDPGHERGYERRSISETLTKRKNQGPSASGELREESSVDPKR